MTEIANPLRIKRFNPVIPGRANAAARDILAATPDPCPFYGRPPAPEL
jgi:hypothetical protein